MLDQDAQGGSDAELLLQVVGIELDGEGYEIRTSPDDISFTSTAVEMTSSTTNTGSLKKTPPGDLAHAPHWIPLRYSLLFPDYSALNLYLIVDGKVEFANRMRRLQGIASVKQVLKLSKLRSN